jgi:hypothetical protein
MSRSPNADPGKVDRNGQPYRVTATIKLLTEDTFSEPCCRRCYLGVSTWRFARKSRLSLLDKTRT